ncbi:hypothetical protein [Companilactobacillus nodensis]|uniref:Uncharacterized protein n=1 Tax=Companilactobacillus nodensis DSM 19682 = JCM 14932 = NBRC 107160 TaxID=1423775 RepID=A0A0R1KD11_9LACO|nr:hypothetical protein [Companilactobacillus nodensis]KRK78596.1 hypothetical protein FD03_GL002372 [Companilactobacillus nodensis DSM 19682 = JCM 14932 = NBRC 107160]
MDEQSKWLMDQIDQLKNSQPEYERRAFLTALKKIVNEQATRTDQIQHELDGRLWNHDKW